MQWVGNWAGQYGLYSVWRLRSPLLLSTVEEKLQRSISCLGSLLGSSVCPRGDVSADCCGSHQVQVHGAKPPWLIASNLSIGRVCCWLRWNDNRVTNLRYCEYCGKANHRPNVCRFGMPLMCFICKREGHKQKFCKHYHSLGDGKEKGRTSNDVLTNLPNETILSISATETENTFTCNGKHVPPVRKPPHKIGLDAIPTTSAVCEESTTSQYPTKVPPDRMASGCDTDLFKDVSNFRLKFKSNFIIAHVNINTYRHKFAQIQDLLRKRSVVLLAISETKLDNTFPNAQFYVDGFTVYRHDKSSISGGLLIYVRSDIAHRRVILMVLNLYVLKSSLVRAKVLQHVSTSIRV